MENFSKGLIYLLCTSGNYTPKKVSRLYLKMMSLLMKLQQLIALGLNTLNNNVSALAASMKTMGATLVEP